MDTSLNQKSCMDVLKPITKCHCIDLDQTSHSEVLDLDLHLTLIRTDAKFLCV